MKLKDEKWWLTQSELRLEEEYKKALMKTDPSRVDLSASFYKKMHEIIMHQISEKNSATNITGLDSALGLEDKTKLSRLDHSKA